jgi:hypothetical protein
MLMNGRLSAQLQRNTANLLYSDKGYLVIDIPTGLYDDYNQPITTESEIYVECAFTDKPASEQWKAYVDVEELAAEVRFNGPVPSKGDRFKLYGRFGGDTTINETYEIFGIRNRDKFGYSCALKLVVV